MDTLPLHFRAPPTPAHDAAADAASSTQRGWYDTRPMCFRSEAFAEDLQELCSPAGRAQPLDTPGRDGRRLLRLSASTLLTGVALAGTLLGLAGATARLFGS